IASWYNYALKDVQDIVLPHVHPDATHVYHVYVIRTKSRYELQKHLGNKGIGTLIHYPIPLHLQKAYQYLHKKRGDYPIAEEIADTCLSLPLWPGIQKNEVEYISEAIRLFFNK
ncbi:MAG TPA: DegT/DnrJ/EryC1/StrS family aminotransferase, partial [Mucilaginibacter sp.]|nr:DegT/DnrJ/EryC1/StrS family aminotransferase [Mucilaginibacter sp.]